MAKNSKKNKDKQQDNKIAKVAKKIKKIDRAVKRGKGKPYGMSISDRDLLSGVHQMINTLFYPQLGVHRGVARAFTETGLARVGGTIAIPAGTAVNNVLSILIQPGSSATNGWFKYEWGTSFVIDGSATSINAGITSTQAVDYRVLGCEVTITPQGSFNNQAGAGALGYVPDIASFVSTSTNIAQLAIKKEIKAMDAYILHWVPTDAEQAFCNIAATPSSVSAFHGYLSVPSGSASVTSFVLDYTLVYEFVPTNSYRPWVSRSKPSIDPRVFKYVNEYAERNSDPLMIGTVADYTAYLKNAILHEGGLMGYESVAAATHTSMSKALTDNKNWFVHALEGDLDGAAEHARAFGLDVGTALLNGGLGIVNQLIPGEDNDLGYIA